MNEEQCIVRINLVKPRCSVNVKPCLEIVHNSQFLFPNVRLLWDSKIINSPTDP